MKFRLSVVSLAIILTLSACSPRAIYKPVHVKFDSITNWPAYYEAVYQALRTIESKARISIESTDLATNITVDLLYAAPDTLFLQAEGPFGLDLGKIFIGKDRFILYNQFNNQFITGSLHDEYYNTFLQTDFSFSDLKNAFIGMAPLPGNATLVDSEKGVFVTSRENQRWLYTVDRTSGNLTLFEIEEQGQVIFRQEFLNYSNIEGLIFPRFTKVLLPQKKEMVAIYHKNIKINQKVDKARYSIEISPKTKQLIIEY